LATGIIFVNNFMPWILSYYNLLQYGIVKRTVQT
jgi:hypothetical protein